MATSGKIVAFFEKAIETYEHQMDMLGMTDFEKPDAADMQNSNNYIWRDRQQHAPVIKGWDLTGQEQEIIQEQFPSSLGEPTNDYVEQRADQLRDKRYWERRGEQAGMRQATELNKDIAKLIAEQGSLFYRVNTASAYEFVANAQTVMNERQAYESDRYFMFNDRDNLTLSVDLSNRGTIAGRSEDTWENGLINPNVAGFRTYTGSFLPNLAGGASPDTTVVGDQSFKPEGGTVSSNGAVVTNTDCRLATIPVLSSAGYNVGDKISFSNVQSVGLADKTETGQDMTFTIVGIPDGTTIEVFPKPIAVDDPSLTLSEAAVANVNTQILDGAVVTRLNIDTTAKTNLFWDKSAIEVLGGTIPAEYFKQFSGQKVISETMSNGQEMYLVYDSEIADMTFSCRLFTWRGVTMRNPENAGVAVLF